jgi:hypothetical protein
MADDEGPTFEDCASPEARGLVRMAVKWMAEARRQFDEAATDEERVVAAERLARWTLEAAASVIGFNALKMLYNPQVGKDRHLALLNAWQRLGIVEPLFGGLESSDDLGSIRSLRAEILAVANGDKPLLLARLPAKAKYRVSTHRLRALQWVEHLKSEGHRPNEATAEVLAGFNLSPSTLRDWRKDVEKNLGSANVQMCLDWAARGTDPHFWDVKGDTVKAGQLMRADSEALTKATAEAQNRG